MTNNELMKYDEVSEFGKAMVASGYFQDASKVSQAIVKIQAGAELGIPPFAAMSGIHIIQGKPELGANLIASLIKNDPRYDYRVVIIDDSACLINFFENDIKIGESSFTKEDANRAGTKNMGKFPRNMLFARALSNGAKWFVPGVFGGIPVYVEGEISNNEVIDVTPQPANESAPSWDELEAGDDDPIDPAPAKVTEDDFYTVDEWPTTLAEFAKEYASANDYYKNNYHVVGQLKKDFGDDIGITFKNRETIDYLKALEVHADEDSNK